MPGALKFTAFLRCVFKRTGNDSFPLKASLIIEIAISLFLKWVDGQPDITKAIN
jgi:hypothetical protein